jgi:type IX secretion system PorP/SprF family membrane protein
MKKILFVLILIAGTLNLKAQGVHYSQFYAVPTTLNPALTGFSESPFRVSGIVRSQWAGFAPFTTQSMSAEWTPNFLGSDPGYGNKTGFGVLFTTDQAGADVGIRTTKMHFSIAHNVSVSDKLYIGAGIQGGYVQRTLFGDHTFPDEYGNQQPAPNLNTNASIGDFGLGVNTAYSHSADLAFFFGAAYFQNANVESFTNLTTQRYGRYVTHLGSRYHIIGGPISIVPNIIFMGVPQTANGAQELNLGVDVDYELSTNTSRRIFTLGSYVRPGDAVIVHASVGDGINWAVGVSYDINYSDLQVVSNNQGGFEIAIRLGIPFTKNEIGIKANRCPTM